MKESGISQLPAPQDTQPLPAGPEVTQLPAHLQEMGAAFQGGKQEASAEKSSENPSSMQAAWGYLDTAKARRVELRAKIAKVAAETENANTSENKKPAFEKTVVNVSAAAERIAASMQETEINSQSDEVVIRAVLHDPVVRNATLEQQLAVAESVLRKLAASQAEPVAAVSEVTSAATTEDDSEAEEEQPATTIAAVQSTETPRASQPAQQEKKSWWSGSFLSWGKTSQN